METNTEKCAICDKPLSVEELFSLSLKSVVFSKTCNKHRWASSFFMGVEDFRQQYKDGLPFIRGNFIYSHRFPAGIEV